MPSPSAITDKFFWSFNKSNGEQLSISIMLLFESFLCFVSFRFVDGTKMEANANRYTFVWRGTLNYYLARNTELIKQ